MADHLDALAVIQKGATVEDVSNHLGIDLFDAHRLVEDLRRERKIKWNRLGWWEARSRVVPHYHRELVTSDDDPSCIAYRMREEGKSWKEIAAELGNSNHKAVQHGARGYALRRGWKWPIDVPRSPRPDPVGEESWRLHSEGRSWREVGRLMGRPMKAVQAAGLRYAKRQQVATVA